MTTCTEMALNTGIYTAAERPSPLLRLILALLGWQRRARERAHLAALSDAHLKDVGLSRADVAWEADKPFWRG